MTLARLSADKISEVIAGLRRISSRSVNAAEQIKAMITYLDNLRDGLDSKRLCAKMCVTLKLTGQVIDQSLSTPAFYLKQISV